MGFLTLLGLGAFAVAAPVLASEISPLGDFRSRLAQKLGVEESEFCEATKEVQIEMLEEKDLDEDKKSQIKQKIEKSECGVRPYGGKNRRAFFAKNADELAKFLGVTVEDLQEAKEQGVTIKELAEENGVSEEELHDFMMERKEEMKGKFMEKRREFVR